MGISRGTLLLDEKWSQKNATSLSERIRLIEQHITDLEQTPHAHAYADNINQLITISATGTPTDITGFLADHESGFLFQNSKEFKSLITGHSIVLYTLSFDPVPITAQEYEFTIALNGVWQSTSTNHIVTAPGAGGVEYSISGNGVFELRPDDLIKLQVQNFTSAGNINIQHINLTIFRVHF